MSIMRDNQKIVIQRLGESFRDCTEIVAEPLRNPGPGEILVRHHYAGVNGVYDQMMCLDRVEHTRVSPPADTGVEAVGLIEAVGDGVENLRVGDPVAVVKAGFAYRHRQICAPDEVIPIPEASPRMLALIPSGVSALLALERVGELASDEVVCISAAAGGLGNIAVQLAVAAGNHVVAICGDERKAEWLESVGVARVVRYRHENLAEIMNTEYEDRLDLVMDSVGGKCFDALLHNLAPHGRLVSCGYTSDRIPTAKVLDERIYAKLYWKAASVRGFMNYRFSQFAPEARKRLMDMTLDGSITPLVDESRFHGLESVADAVDHLLAGKNLGKVVVDLR
jgi:NADPH-dependent curcumin reductase CurA